MRPGETIATYDVGLALRGKSGRFEVTSPSGEIYEVSCKSNHSSDLVWSSNGTDQPPFLIRKVAERASLAETTATTDGMRPTDTETASSRLPFVLEHVADEGQPSNLVNSNLGNSNIGNLELLYLEDDPETGQPSACVCLKGELRGHAFEAERLMTSRCATFNELDSEIRRLQAKLDEIRLRAKKMFYKTQAVAATA
jgi:hypothetical protein